MAVLTAQQVYAAARGAGASHQEAITLTAIAKGESGWRTDAHNPVGRDNSYGIWQINMLGQMGVDRARQWGLKNYEELWDPRINAKAALSILRSQGWNAWTVYSKGIYKQYLGEAQAAGNAIQNNWWEQTYDSSTFGNGQQVTANSSGAGAGGPAGGGGGGTVYAAGGGMGGPGLPPNASPEQIEDYIREFYPQAAGFLDIPEIRLKLIEAARSEWSPTKLQAEIQATKWWRTNSAATRQYFALRSADPAQFKALITAKAAEIGPALAQAGVTGLDSFLAEGAIKYGWSDAELRDQVAGILRKQSGKSGLAQESAPDITADSLMTMARTEYFVPISRQDAERWAIDIYAGRKTEDTLRDYFGQLASARFPGLAEQGFSPGEYMAPVRNMIAETLEMNPADIDLLDRRWSEVLETEGSDGKFRPMTLGEASRWARKRQEYQTTQGAKDEAAAMAETIAKTFGAV